MKTAGLVLDFYDDLNGKFLKETFPTADSLPEVVKTAHILSSEEREVLRDEAYALVLVNEGKTLRKFACVDAGNTLLSALYFMQNKDSLPVEAQKVASVNIESACKEFGLPLENLEKIAARGQKAPTAVNGGSARSRDPMQQPIVGDDANWAERTNLISVRGGADSGRVVPTASQMKTASFEDEHGIPDAKAHHGKKKGKKVNYLDDFHKQNPEAKPPAKKEKDSNADCVKMGQAVNVTELTPPVRIEKQAAKRLALDRYPLDRYEDVQKAVSYFTDYRLEMSPEDRHNYAVKVAARAEELGIKTTDDLDRYGSVEYAPDVEAHLANRRAIAPDFTHVWNELQEKRASIEPETFARLLAEADEEAGVHQFYGGEACDPFFATFGGNKVKEADIAWNWQSRTGDYVSGDQIKRLALNGRPLVEKQFNADLAKAFANAPIAIFESLPDLHKKVLARLANQEFDGTPNN